MTEGVPPVTSVHREPSVRLNRRRVLTAAAGATALTLLNRGSKAAAQDNGTPSASPASGWSFTDDRGVTLELPSIPTRIVAQTSAAAALWDLGVRPVGVFGPYKNADGSNDFQAGNLDFDAVDYLGDYGAIDLEKLVALKPDLVVDMTIYDGQFWYMETIRNVVERVAPTLGITMQAVPIIASIERFEELARSLGADFATSEIRDASSAFDAAIADFQIAVAAKPGLTVLVTSPSLEQYYVASPNYMTDLMYFRDLGLDILSHETEDFFELLSWEEAGKYLSDVILIDARTGGSYDDLLQIDTWASLPAVQAGQLGNWYAGAPYSRARLAPIVTELTDVVRNARADVV